MNQSVPLPADAWPVRAVQLDLARQRETLDTIRGFIDFAARWGFNTLHVYLEGVIRTESFPYREPGASYSPDDMRRLVEAADDHGMEVVPCVNTLGHAEHFTQCRELSHLAETGRSAPGGHMFCPSLPETYEFLENYLGEVAPLFPGGQFNIGGDEAWHLGCCPRCRQRLEAGEIWADLFIEHVQKMVGMMRGLGKPRIWMWDDLLDFFEDFQIDRLPRDLVMCAWRYNADKFTPAGVQGHFNKGFRRDWLGLYERLGFDVLIAPNAKEVQNLFAFNRYARPHRVLGGLQTMWGLTHHHFLSSRMCSVALAGYTWSHPSGTEDQAMARVIESICPAATKPARLAFRRLIGGHTVGGQGPLPASVAVFYRGIPPLAREQAALGAVIDEQLIGALEPSEDEPWAGEILGDLHAKAREQVLSDQLREIVPLAIDPRTHESERARLAQRVGWCRDELGDLAQLRTAQWSRQRQGLGENTAAQRYRALDAELAPLMDELHRPLPPGRAIIELNLFLYEAYSSPRLKIELRVDGRWREVAANVYKPLDLRGGFFLVRLPVVLGDERPEAMRLTVSGYGGQGVGYGAVYFARQSWVPVSVAHTEGLVVTPDAVLRDDASRSYLGRPDTVDTLLNFREDEPATLEVSLVTPHTYTTPLQAPDDQGPTP